MKTVSSMDGVQLAYDKTGEGPPIIMVVGAFNVRSTTAPLAAELQSSHTVFNYDRRGRGDSGDGVDYSPEREIDDLDVLIQEAGGSACVFGYSSGAVLALKAAASGVAIEQFVLYEPPFLVDDSRPRPGIDLPRRLAALVGEGRRGDAVELYQTEGIGIPEEMVIQMRDAPFRPGLEGLAHTLVYDAEITGDLTLPTSTLETIQLPTLVIDGGKSWGFLRSAARAVADALPHAQQCTLAGETHTINPTATAAAIQEFLAGSGLRRWRSTPAAGGAGEHARSR
jgi:pimeloyl-ACP methyl ester carboxylesterase